SLTTPGASWPTSHYGTSSTKPPGTEPNLRVRAPHSPRTMRLPISSMLSTSQHTAPLFGYHMPSFSFQGVPAEQLFEHFVALTQAAESAGFDLVRVMDHFYQIRGLGPETEPMLEAYSTLAALAARTSRVQLGTLVTGVTYRHPALLAKMVSTLLVVSMC